MEPRGLKSGLAFYTLSKRDNLKNKKAPSGVSSNHVIMTSVEIRIILPKRAAEEQHHSIHSIVQFYSSIGELRSSAGLGGSKLTSPDLKS